MLSRFAFVLASFLIFVSYANVFLGYAHYFNIVSVGVALTIFLLGVFVPSLASVLGIALLVAVYFCGFPSWHFIGFIWQLSCAGVCLFLSGVLWRKENNDVSGLLAWAYPLILCACSLYLLPHSGVASMIFEAPWQQTFSEIIWHVPTHDHYSYAQIIRMVMYVCLASLIVLTMSMDNIRLAIVIGLLSSVALCCADAFSLFDITWLPDNKAYNGLFDTPYGNYNWYVQVLVPGVIILMGGSLFQDKNVFLRGALILLLLVFVFLMGSRLAVAVSALCLVVALYHMVKRKGGERPVWKQKSYLYVLFAFIFVGVLTVFFANKFSWGDAGAKFGNLFESDRFDHWENAVAMIGLNPWVGYGLDSFHRIDIELSEAKKAFGYPYTRVGYFFKDTPHNEILSLWQGLGLFGLLLWLSLFALAIRGFCKMELSAKRLYWLLALGATLLLIIFQEMTYIGPVCFFAFLILSLGLKNLKINQRWHFVFLTFTSLGIVSYASQPAQGYLDRLTIDQKNQIAELSDLPAVGVYGWEDWNEGKTRWLSAYAVDEVHVTDDFLAITLDAQGPHTSKGRQINVDICVEGKMRKIVVVGRDDVEKIVLDVSEYVGQVVSIVYRVDKYFASNSFNISKDYRILGVALREYQFYHKEDVNE